MTLLTLIGLWAFPLTIWFWRDRIIALTERNWTFMDRSPWQGQGSSPSYRHYLHLDLAWKVGLLAGLACWTVLLLVRIFLRLSGLATAINNDPNLIDIFYYSQIALAVLFQACSAALVATRVRELSSLHGLMSAFIGGCIMALGIIVLNLLFGGTIDPEITWLTVSLVVNGGALLALLVAMGVSTLTGWINQPKSQISPG